MPAHSKRTVFLVLILAAILLRLPLLFRPAPVFNSRPFIEDAYYSLSVARSLGHGNGLTIDGEHLTNGIQPLIVFLYAPAFALFDDDTALRVCLALVILIELFLIVMVRRKMLFLMGRDREHSERAANIATFLLLFSYASTVYTLNGLETALAASLALSTVYLYIRVIQSDRAQAIAPYAMLGAVGGLTVLARIDTAFLVAVVFALHTSWSMTRQIPFARRALQAVVFGAVAVAVSSPWWIYNYVYFGSVTPTSGLSQRVVIPLLENLASLAQLLSNKMFVIGYLPYSRTLRSLQIVMVLVIFIAPVLMVLVPRVREKTLRFIARLNQRWRFKPLVPLLAYIAFMAAYYLLNFGAPHFLQRYLFPGHIVWTILVGIVAAELWSRIEARSKTLARSIAAFAAIGALVVYAFPYSWNYSPDKARQNDFLQVSQYISDNLPSSARIGMGQSGTAGFFNTNVVNLDGKVNADVFRANEAGRICAYIDSARFDYLIDWQHFFTTLGHCQAVSEYAPVDTVGRFLVYKHLP